MPDEARQRDVSDPQQMKAIVACAYLMTENSSLSSKERKAKLYWLGEIAFANQSFGYPHFDGTYSGRSA